MRVKHTHAKFLLLGAIIAHLGLAASSLAATPRGDSGFADRLDVIGAKVHGQPPVTFNDLQAIEPACVLVLRHVKREQDNPELGVWYEQLKNSPLLDLPENQIAKGALSFHHYCWGEIVRNRFYRETDANKRKELAEYAMSGSKYVIDFPQYRSPNWPYLSHVYVTMGTAYLLMKDRVAAINAFLMALRINPRERKAYIHLSDTLAEAGKKEEALKHVTEGLRYFPKTKALTRRYQELGGKLPYPEPHPDILENNKTNEEQGVQGAETVTQTPEGAAKVTEPQNNPTLPGQPYKADPSNKDNPYCRFCAE